MLKRTIGFICLLMSFLLFSTSYAEEVLVKPLSYQDTSPKMERNYSDFSVSTSSKKENHLSPSSEDTSSFDNYKFEQYNSDIIGDGYRTGKTIGHRAGRTVKKYVCNSRQLNCKEEE